MKLIIYVFAFLCVDFFALKAQNKYDQVWMIENKIIDWGKETAIIKQRKTVYDLGISTTNICDKYGKLKYYSNGCAIMGANHKVLPHGDTLSPGEIFDSYCRDGLFYPSRNCVTILPMPNDTNRYFTFHVGSVKETPFDTTGYPAWHLYYSEINSTLNNGIGDVVKKNILIVQDTFLASGVKAVRHANGKDWWIICHELFSPSFQTALLSDKGVIYQGRKVYKGKALTNNTSKGSSNFSPNGKKYATGNPYDGIHIFDFDPCNGNFSNQRYINIGFNQYSCVGVEFSPNSRFLYVSLGDELRQYDMQAADIIKSGILIATIDTTLKEPSSFYSMALSPNGKIYMAATHSNMTLNTIHKPDLKGTACEFKQQDFLLPSYTYVALPNIPKFRGNEIDEKCGGVATEDKVLLKTAIYPNPVTQGTVNIDFFDMPDFNTGHWQLFNITGQQVAQFELKKGHLECNFDLGDLAKGLYFYGVELDGRLVSNGKLVLE